MRGLRIINSDTYDYDGYNSDFGPLTLSQIQQYCKDVKRGLAQGIVLHVCSTHYKKQVNAVFLLAGYMLVCEGYSIH